MNESELLYSFLLDTHELEILESKINEFNPLRIMKVESHEIRHSNIISWLFTPSENHNLSDKILKKFLLEVVLNNESIALPITVSDVYLSNYADAVVYREYKNIDIFIQSEQNKTILLVENKIAAKETEGQLEKYFEYVYLNYRDYSVIPILLTVHGDEPIGSEKYLMFSHENLYRIISDVIQLERENMNQNVVRFIEYYLQSMELILMENDVIVDLCKNIYRKHKNAIDIIIKYSKTSVLDPIFDDFIKDHPGIIESYRNNYSFWFIPPDIAEILPTMNHIWQSPYPFSFWFYYEMERNSMGMILEIGPWNDQNSRLEFINYLSANKIKLNKRAFSADAKYTRVFSKYNKFTKWENEEDLLKEMNKLYDESNKESLKHIIAVMKNYDWSLVPPVPKTK